MFPEANAFFWCVAANSVPSKNSLAIVCYFAGGIYCNDAHTPTKPLCIVIIVNIQALLHAYTFILEEGTDASQAKDHSKPDHKDDGYMPMLPGGAPATPTSKSGWLHAHESKKCVCTTANYQPLAKLACWFQWLHDDVTKWQLLSRWHNELWQDVD